MAKGFDDVYTVSTGEWIIVRHFLNNPLRNFNYVLIHKPSGSAVSIDPTDVAFNMHVVESYNAKLVAILLTHEHADHLEGVSPLVKLNPLVNVYGPNGIEPYLDQAIAERTELVSDGKVITLGSFSIRVIDLSGHTLMHVGYYIEDETPILVSGDTVFALGVGHCRFGGTVEGLFSTIQKIRTQFDDGKTIYLPGHDLLESNLAFTRQFDWPMGKAIDELESEPESRPLRSISDECRENLFFNSEQSKLTYEDTGNASADPKTVFISLREQRDKW